MTWSGTAVIEPGRLVYLGALGSAHTHTHAAVQIAVAIDGRLRFSDASGDSAEGFSAVIPAGVTHAFDAGAATGLMIYVEPSGAAGRSLAALFAELGRHRAQSWTTAAAALVAPPDVRDVSAAADAVLDVLVGDPRPLPRRDWHPSVRRAMEVIPEMLDGPVRIGEVAREVNLSADRLGRLFARDVGLSFPACVRWARLMRALETARRGGSLTEAAHAAGFADSSHANKAFHEMFGLAPTTLREGVQLR
ncbi:helix-turn-helix domain-containing protein [Mycolicibacterium phlei]